MIPGTRDKGQDQGETSGVPSYVQVYGLRGGAEDFSSFPALPFVTLPREGAERFFPSVMGDFSVLPQPKLAEGAVGMECCGSPVVRPKSQMTGALREVTDERRHRRNPVNGFYPRALDFIGDFFFGGKVPPPFVRKAVFRVARGYEKFIYPLVLYVGDSLDSFRRARPQAVSVVQNNPLAPN